MTEETSIIYVVDDDPSVRKALERLLRSAGHAVKVFSSALELLDFPHTDTPGCLVLDIKMPKLSGLKLQERLAEKGILFPIIFITGHGTVPTSVQAFKAGAMDFLQKPFKDRELLDAVSRGVEKHRRLRQEQHEMKVLRKRLETLTPREREVFRLVVTGMLNKQVAYDLGIAEKTIKVHRARVMEKMAAQSLADLVRFAEKLGIGSSTTRCPTWIPREKPTARRILGDSKDLQRCIQELLYCQSKFLFTSASSSAHGISVYSCESEVLRRSDASHWTKVQYPFLLHPAIFHPDRVTFPISSPFPPWAFPGKPLAYFFWHLCQGRIVHHARKILHYIRYR